MRSLRAKAPARSRRRPHRNPAGPLHGPHPTEMTIPRARRKRSSDQVRSPTRHDRMSDCLCDTAVTRRHDGSMAATSAVDATYEAVGPRQYLDRFLAEYGLNEEHVRDRIKVRVDGP